MNAVSENKWLLLLLFMAGTLLVSCSGNDHPSDEDQDSTAVSSTTANAEIRQWLSGPVLGEWFRQAQRKDSSLKETGFLPLGTDSLQLNSAEQKISDKEWNVYQAYFFYSPDKGKAIDLYSYGTMPVKQDNGSVTLQRGEADDEVSLVNVKTRTKQRILFSGPGTIYQKAVWLGDSAVLITGMSDANEANKMLPVIWQINLSDSTVKAFSYQATSDSLGTP